MCEKLHHKNAKKGDMLYFPGKIDKLIIQPTNQSIQVGGAIFGCTIRNHVGYTLLVWGVSPGKC